MLRHDPRSSSSRRLRQGLPLALLLLLLVVVVVVQ
jgi:hypothetical protein